MITFLVGAVQRLVGAQTIDQIIYDRLLPNEEIFMIDGPATIALFIHKLKWIIALVVLAAGAFIVPGPAAKLAFMVLAGIAAAVLVIGAVQFHYTRYVVTGNRMIYLSGVINRSHQWIPWAKVTDLSYSQRWDERLQNIGRVRIESANEASPFAEMRDLSHPETMMRVLAYMVSQRQGRVLTPADLHAELGIPGSDGVLRMPAPPDDEDGRGERGDGGPDGGPEGDDTGPLDAPSRPAGLTARGPLAPAAVSVPGPTGGGESRPSRANPVSDVPRARVKPRPPDSQPAGTGRPPRSGRHPQQHRDGNGSQRDNDYGEGHDHLNDGDDPAIWD